MASRPEHQSIRASCDRCRAKKLGCTISTSDTSRARVQQCVRCLRAKVDCVFSRRAQTRRSSDAKRASGQCSDITPTAMPETCCLQTHMGMPPSLSSSESLSGLSVDWPMWTLNSWSDDTVGGQGEPSDAEILDVNDDITGGIIHHINNGKAPGSLQREIQLTNLFNPISSSSIAGDTCVEPELSRPSPESFIHLSSSDLSNNTPSTTEGSSGTLTENGNNQGIEQLLGLVAAVHEALLTLTSDSPYPSPHSNGTGNVDTYPIGQVLRLTKRFAAGLRSFWTDNSTDRNQQERHSSSSFSLASPISHIDSPNMPRGRAPLSECLNNTILTTTVASADVTDVPTMLLVLSCYASLTKLYMIVFSQIENSLKRLPDAMYAPQTQHFLQGEEDLQLGELFSATNETCSKMYIAVQILLDEFQAMDDIVSPPNLLNLMSLQKRSGCNPGQGKGRQMMEGDFRSTSIWFTHQLETVRSVLKEDARRIFGRDKKDFHGLFQQGHCLKVMLRERMNC